MSANGPELELAHRRLHGDAAALFRALDANDRDAVVRVLRAFLSAVEAHLRIDATAGYRLLLRHPSESVRRVAERVLEEQRVFPETFEAFAYRWRMAPGDLLAEAAFRDELETIVTGLMKRLRVEARLIAIRSSVA